MPDIAQFLNAPPINISLDEIRAALDKTPYDKPIHNPDEEMFPSGYDLEYRSAAVLIPIWHEPKDGELYVLLTQRALHMRNHPGQIAFPGGKHDPDDASIQYTALRETLEEVGLAPDCFDLLGELGEYCTISGFCIKPIIAEMTRRSELSLCEEEVKSVHWVPLKHLLDPRNYRFKETKLNKATRGYFEVEYQDIRIWGVTAGILFGLYQTLAKHIR
ncbi:NUDIX hydrolase [Marinomonas transparens]|uniref:CoA pyrophosphatase n=1 Tax=Marinomonas transparens TaxID=2795388 RepID=A0A934MXA7_9GAMM|nr:CoA pyrophosphatase [Marinomonas transparens]MBJ7539109.1 CoA pyrophosphatase [Marinomonas transparens]